MSDPPAVLEFEPINHQYSRFVWSSVRRLGVDMEAMDDVVQEVFMVVHSRLHTLREPDALRSWIYSGAQRVLRRSVGWGVGQRLVRNSGD